MRSCSSICSYLNSARAVRCNPDQIVITNGAQQAISLAALVLLNPHDHVYLENPGYVGARNAFLAANCKITPITTSANVIDINNLPQSPKGKLCYITPCHQYPLGGSRSDNG